MKNTLLVNNQADRWKDKEEKEKIPERNTRRLLIASILKVAKHIWRFDNTNDFKLKVINWTLISLWEIRLLFVFMHAVYK